MPAISTSFRHEHLCHLSGARRFGVGSIQRSVWKGSPDNVAGQTDIGKEKLNAET
jgi:hypothetical protein